MKRKKYNPRKSLTSQVNALLKHYVVVFLGGGKANIYDTKRKRIVGSVPHTIARAFTEMRFKWDVNAIVLCRRQDGQEYFQSKCISTEHEYYHHQLSDLLNGEHRKLVNEANKTHVCNLSWVASTSGEVSDEVLQQIMVDINAWDTLAKWEVEP